MWNGGFIEKDKQIYPFRACKCWACNYPYNRGVVSKLEPLKWFNSTWIGAGICENVYTGGVVEWVFNHSILEPNNSRTARVEHWRATQYSLLIKDCSLDWAPPCIWPLKCWFASLVDLIIILCWYCKTDLSDTWCYTYKWLCLCVQMNMILWVKHTADQQNITTEKSYQILPFSAE